MYLKPLSQPSGELWDFQTQYVVQDVYFLSFECNELDGKYAPTIDNAHAQGGGADKCQVRAY